MNSEYEILELEKDGRRVLFKVGTVDKLEPHEGDFLIGEDGTLHKVQLTGHKITENGKVFYIETEHEPGLLKRVHPKMRFARIQP